LSFSPFPQFKSIKQGGPEMVVVVAPSRGLTAGDGDQLWAGGGGDTGQWRRAERGQRQGKKTGQG